MDVATLALHRRTGVVVLVTEHCPECGRVLHQRPVDWKGDPLWVQCKRCGKMVKVSADGARVVAKAGDD